MLEHDPLVTEYEHERFRPREAEALQTLRKVASLVKPVMRQRGWKVGVMTEFWPDEKSLLGLNWNRGRKICLRLRSPYDERQFLPLEQVVDTMLHELCHIIHGPHNEAFHALWDQLRDEHEALARKGYTGEGFLSTGHKLGGARIPMNEARRRARAAAEKRRVLSAGSGQKLGGAPVLCDVDIRRVIADAAQRRIDVTKGCASGSERSRDLVDQTSKNGFRTKADEDDANEIAIMQVYIDLIQEEDREKYGKDYVPPSRENPAGTHGGMLQKEATSAEVEDETPAVTGPRPELDLVEAKHPDPLLEQPIDGWACDICTLYNPSRYLCCDACGIERPETTFNRQSDTGPRPQTSKKVAQGPLSRPADTEREKPADLGRRAPATASSRLKPQNSLQTLSLLYESESKKPLGWLCDRCGTFMEREWWTCAQCGEIKISS